MPQNAARYLIPRFSSQRALRPTQLEDLDIELLAQARLEDYAGQHRQFPVIIVGAALGGASAFLSLALNAPFLPEAFVSTLAGGSPDGDVYEYYQQSAELALRIAAKNPSVMTIQHYDPIHDEWMTRRVNHLRLKLLDIPGAYQDFILKHLQPRGVICYLDCKASWLRYRLGERSVFQVGGWGGISAEEFLDASPRIQAYAARVGLSKTAWKLSGFPLERGPESEWGSEVGLGEALQGFCAQHGYQFFSISLQEPHDYSLLAFRAMEKLLQIEERQPAGILIEMFSQFDPMLALKGSLLPVWLVFNTWDSLDFLKSMTPLFPTGKPILFSPLSTFTLTPDLVPWSEWENALQNSDWRNVGTRPSHYPSDPLTLIDWAEPVYRWADVWSRPVSSRLDVDQIAQLIQNR